MKATACLLIILLTISCSPLIQENKLELKRTVVYGKVVNFNCDTPIDIYINRLGFKSRLFSTEIDSFGCFSIDIDLYMPTDAFFQYNTNFMILLHPGDSLYVEFDAKFKDRPDLLGSIKFHGDGAIINQEASAFQLMYFLSNVYGNQDEKNRIIEGYDFKEYKLYLDTIKQRRIQICEKFVSEISPSEKTRNWVLAGIEQRYYSDLALYPDQHIESNNLTAKDWRVPTSYYDPLFEKFPFTDTMLISAFAINDFVNKFYSVYMDIYFYPEIGFLEMLFPRLRSYKKIHGIIESTTDTLLRQLVLTDMFVNEFENKNTRLFERYTKIFDTYIQEPYLRDPLLELYYQTKREIENPSLSSNAIHTNLTSSPVNQIIDSIIINNQGKIIYVDCWATWCGPCRTEMPNSKKLMKNMAEKEVAFVYLCLDSEEGKWRAYLDEYQLTGQHFYLTQKQSSEIREIFEITGVPYYILFDKKGIIVQKGSHLRPDIAQEIITKLLKK